MGQTLERGGATMVLRVGYDGTGFSGYAAQEGQPHVRTVAGELAEALRVLLRHEPELTCAGRTDAGVHARAQHVSLPVDAEERARIDGARLVRSLGSVLPEDVRVTEVLEADAGFSARFDARARRYRYRIACGPVQPLFCARWTWWLRAATPWELDVDAMERASRCLVGEHDFKSFCKAASALGKPTCRFVESIDFAWEEPCGERVLAVDVVGNAFLHSMVRTMVGTLVEVGRGARPEGWVADALAACDRRAAGPCAPACGLTFWDVRYDEGALRPW
jgi:tRNA pseudouridine38-40 synthase